ncbi:DUF551 domain-containing protein [Escherichia coli]|nr:DUF551 domain-containing protein [Escherichia coli]EFJ2880112.1 DUF551 domain-containing protein [Escherichia coli]
MTTITKERAEIKSFITGFLCDPAHDNQSSDSLLANVFRIALASLEAEPVVVNDDMAYAFHHALSDSSLGADEVEEIKAGLRAAFANVTIQPEPVVPDEIELAIENLKQKLVECNRYNYCADAVKGVEDACHAAMLQGIQPVSQTYNLPELIEGMEVSIDVSTCDADLGNRYFGTVTEALELDTAKNGYILLVQDAEPNFDVNGNSPVTPDGWISCSERMPEKGQNVLISVNFDSSLVEPLICSARYTGSTFRRGDATIKPGNGIEQASHWMPLPEPPQEAK